MTMEEQSFAIRGQTQADYKEACAAAQETDTIELVPDPGNKFHDLTRFPGTTAIKVMANGAQLGFVAAELCGWAAANEMRDLRLHRSARSGMLLVYFKADDTMPRQASTKKQQKATEAENV